MHARIISHYVVKVRHRFLFLRDTLCNRLLRWASCDSSYMRGVRLPSNYYTLGLFSAIFVWYVKRNTDPTITRKLAASRTITRGRHVLLRATITRSMYGRGLEIPLRIDESFFDQNSQAPQHADGYIGVSKYSFETKLHATYRALEYVNIHNYSVR